jgi:hypothetical protein
MAQPTATRPKYGWFKRWLLEGHLKETEGPYEKERHAVQHQRSWWQVMCLTGVDYFSTLGYQPGIAALAAGALSPFATFILVLLTLFGALPMYKRVAAASPHGDGSISMLERLLPWWQGKLLVLCLIGFAATSFIITITLSAADATAHIVENPFAPAFAAHQVVAITLVLIATLGAIFLRGFGEAIGIAVALVGIYLLLNSIVVADGLYQVIMHPPAVIAWQQALFSSYGSPLAMLAAALLVFPRLALGLSGFETGVVVMPLVRGDPTDTQENPGGRIRNTRLLLTAAALIMSVLLITSSFVTTVLIPHQEFEEGGKASGRALAYLAHTYLGDIFGTAYDLSTILILWFAGASAMAGLLNIVPRYLPRYGMAPEWTRATRPLVLIFTAICFLVTILFQADVEAQGGAYATGVLTLMGSAAVAVTLATWRERKTLFALGFGAVTLIFLYTIVVNIFERPEGLQIAGLFILGIIVVSLISRIWRSTELRVERVEIDETAARFIDQAAKRGVIRVIANQLDSGDAAEYREKEREVRIDTHLPPGSSVLFLEVTVCDPSEFADVVEVKGAEVGKYRVLRAESSSVPNAIAALLMHIREKTDTVPHVYFEWIEGNPVSAMLRFLLFGEGDIAPVTHEVLRKAERDPARRPVVHVGG